MIQRRKLIRRAGICLGALVVLAAVSWTLWNHTASRAIEQAIARLSAAGLPTSAAQVKPPAAPPGENAAPLYQAAFALLDGLPEEVADADLDLEKLPEVPEATRRAVESASEVLELLHRAARLPRCVRPLKYERGIRMEVPHLLSLRRLSTLLTARAVARSEMGDVDGAASDLHALFALARSVREEPYLVAQLVRITVDTRALRALEVLLPRLESPARALETIDPDAIRGAIAFAERGEVVLCALRVLDQDLLEVMPGPVPGAWILRLGWLTRPYLKQEMARLVGLLQDFAEVAARPYPDAIPAWNAAFADAARGGGILVRLYTSSCVGMLLDEARIASRVELARAAALCLEHRRKRGAYPRSLDELETKAPEDPLGGRPFALKLEGGAAVLSSAADAEVVWRLPGG